MNCLFLGENAMTSWQSLPQSDVRCVHSVHSPSFSCICSLDTFYQNLYCMSYSTLLLDLKISSVGVLDLGLPPLLLVPLTHRLWFWKTQSLIRTNTRKLTASTLVEWTLDSSQNCSANEKLSPYMAFVRLGLKVNSCSCDWVWQGWTRQGTVWDA